MKPALIASHLATLAVGAAAVYVVVPSIRSPQGAGGGSGAVTTFSGEPGQKGSSSSATGLPTNLTSVNLGQAGYQMGTQDPLAAIAAAKNIPGRDNRYLFSESVYTAWGEKNGLEAAQWAVANLKGTEKSDALYNIADGWGEADPAAAALWFSENTSGVIREDAIYEILESWGRKSPDNALAWAESLDEYTRSMVMDSLADGWASHDPEGAAKAATKLLEYDFGDEFVMRVAGQWATESPTGAAAWAGTLENTDARAIAHLEIGTSWAQDDPAKATSWIESLSSDDDKLYASLGVAMGWAEHDPGNALKWAVTSVQTPETRQRIIEDVMLDWSSSDPAAAADWLNAQPKGPQNDEVLATFSSAIIDVDPESAVTWASTISDAAKRDESVAMLLEEWIAMDGDNARQWVAASNLSADLKSRFGPSN